MIELYYPKESVYMRYWRMVICCLVLAVSACSTDSRLFGYTLWGRPGNSANNGIVTVRKGDTLYSIARANDVPIREVIETNNLRPPYTLHVGQSIRLPRAKYHIVAKGDTLYNISKRYNVDMPTLSRTNNLQAPFTLKIGQKLLMPGSIVTSPTTSSSKTTHTVSKSSSALHSRQTAAAQPSTRRSQKFIWPVKGQVISKFGPIAKGRNNDGINIKVPKGTPVKAADSGTVAYAGNELKGFGNLILIKHPDGWVTAYAHNDTLKVRKGQKVTKGTIISTVGNSGGVGTPQLHFETRAGKKALNPQSYLQ